jgi:hypothetical protein
LETAESFSGGAGEASIILKAKATRGLYVGKHSRYPDEEELICGGPVKIVGIYKQEGTTMILDAVFV